ncbi:MAG: hypothetical protein AAF298_28625, partial [Cyanobacteria bacterium P01_A01_bin.40]
MKQSVILNSGFAAWAFAELADDLARELNLKVVATPGDYNYVLSWDEPMVYRIYCAGRNLFGWNVRKFPPQQKKQPWVAHAQGAIYEVLNEV